MTTYIDAKIAYYANLDDTNGMPPTGKIVAFGSSSIELWSNIATDLAPEYVINRGASGAHTSDFLAFYDALIVQYQPKGALIYVGENDVFGMTASEITADLIAGFNLLFAALPNLRIFYMSMKPSPDRWAYWSLMQESNAAMAAHCNSDTRLTYIDVSTALLSGGTPNAALYSDGLHLNSAGYAVWASIVQPVLNGYEWETPTEQQPLPRGVVLSASTWTALLAAAKRSAARANAFANELPTGSHIKLYSGASLSSLASATLIRTIETGAWSVDPITADGRYPIRPGTFTDPATGAGTPNLAVITDETDAEVARVTAGVGSGVLRLSEPIAESSALTPGSFALILQTSDVPSPPPAGGSAWSDVAIRDMRKVDWTGTYMTSYAANDDTLWGRNSRYYSSQSERGQLSMGRYPSDVAFTTTNPDYPEISWAASTFSGVNWGRINVWNQIYLGETYKDSHVTGWVNNTRVMCWDFQVWIKRKSTGGWVRVARTDYMGGEAWDVTFGTLGAASKFDLRSEVETGYPSVRMVLDAGAPYVPYWVPHGYAGLTAINAADVADVLVSHKSALVVHSTLVDDDREFSRFYLACGADYYPASGTLPFYPGVGTSRHKLVSAKWPSYQYHVMHTMTQAQFEANGGYPGYFADLSEE